MEGVDLNLVHHRCDAVEGGEIDEAVAVEVADADGANFSRVEKFFDGAPCPVYVTVGLVDEVEVEVVKLQTVQAALELCFGGIVAGAVQPQFGGDEDVFPLDTARTDGAADLFFVEVGGSGVDVAVAAGDGIYDDAFAFFRGHLIDAEAEHRDGNAVGQGGSRLDHGGFPDGG